MNQHIIELDTIFRIIFPFAAANVFMVVLIYFTLVRERIRASYPYFAIFIICFILFLCSPLIKAVTPKYISLWYVTVKNILLIGVAFPSLLYGIFILANRQLSILHSRLLYSIGACWSLYYLVYRIQYFFRNETDFDFLKHYVISLEGTFIGSTLYIICIVIFPSVFLLTTKTERSTQITIYGVLLLSIGVLLGHIFRLWELMNLTCALTALLWCWQVFKDVKRTNQELAVHHQHEKALAKAQYASAGINSFNDFYSVEKNIAYPLREREALIEVIRTGSVGLINQKANELILSLQIFTNNQHNLLISHSRETLFVLVDTAIFNGGNKKLLTQRLERKGNEVNRCTTANKLEALLIAESHYLCQIIAEVKPLNPEEELVDTIKNHVLTHYFNNITIPDIANVVGASQSHTMRVFKLVTKQTIKQYIASVRIEKAKLLLLSKSVTESAYESGFNDSNYFATVFKKQTGMTPKQYQLEAKSPPRITSNL